MSHHILISVIFKFGKRDSIEMTEHTPEEIRALRVAVWMVGNMDTQEDKAAWWRDHKPIWDKVCQTISKDEVEQDRALNSQDAYYVEKRKEDQ